MVEPEVGAVFIDPALDIQVHINQVQLLQVAAAQETPSHGNSRCRMRHQTTRGGQAFVIRKKRQTAQGFRYYWVHGVGQRHVEFVAGLVERL